MITLVIPDIHNKFQRAQEIIDRVPQADQVVFLGDYWDDWDDTPRDAYLTAQWIHESMHVNPEWVFLLGNHDIPYLYGVERCSGYTPEKRGAIQAAWGNQFLKLRDNFALYTWVDNWLLTHAGLTNGLSPAEDLATLPEITQVTMANLRAGNSHYLIQPGKDRGGWQRHGGITWCDYSRHQPIPGVSQCFGHTIHGEPQGDLVTTCCLDTNLDHYALITDGVLTTHMGSFV